MASRIRLEKRKGGTKAKLGGKGMGRVENFQSSCAFDVGPFNGSVMHGL